MPKKLKVLYIITGLNTGGVEMMLARTVKETSDRIESVVVSMMDKGTLGAEIESAGASVYTLDMKRNPLGAFRLLRILKKEHPDIIQCKMFHANLLGGLFGTLAGYKKIFWGIHHSYLDGAKLTTVLTNKLSAFFARFCCKKIVCCGMLAREVCLKFGYPEDKLVVIGNGYDTSALYPDGEARAKLRAELSIPENCIAVGHIGRYHKIKNHRGIIEAFAKFHKDVPNSMLFFAGAGVGESPEVRGLIKDLNLAGSVVALGARKDIKNFVNAMDFTVLFSFGEAFPNVLAEAMLCGKIALSSDVGDARFIVDNPDFIVPVGDTDALAKKMREIAEMPPKMREDIALVGRKSIIERFDLHSICTQYEQMWKC